MRIRFALLAVVMLLAVSACGPKYVGMPVNVGEMPGMGMRASARNMNAHPPISINAGETKEIKVYLTHFIFDYKITRTGENTYSMTGVAGRLEGFSVSHGSYYLLLIKDGVVVGECNSHFKEWVPGGYRIAADFESPEFDHITTVYDLRVRKH